MQIGTKKAGINILISDQINFKKKIVLEAKKYIVQ